jgi:hypothetical protein
VSNKIIELYVSMGWDARTHRVFTRPPTDWDEMTREAQEEFLEREARQWAEQEVEVGGLVYDDPSEIDNSRWGDAYDESFIEDMFDSEPPHDRSALDCDENVQLEVVDD